MATLILWDECPMMHSHAFEALDRSLRDIMGQVNPISKDMPFGGKIIVYIQSIYICTIVWWFATHRNPIDNAKRSGS